MDLRTTEEFAQWFSALDQATAEDVAATLEVITQLGAQKEAPGSTEWLTWYEHPGLSERIRTLGPHTPPGMTPDPAMLRFMDAWGHFHGYARRVVKHLESPAFVARASQLDASRAKLVTDVVARIKRAVTKRLLALSEHRRRNRLFGLRPTTRDEEAELASFVDVQEIRDAYLAALGVAGFEVVDVPAHSPALREIALRVPPPGVRLLYGIDVRGDRALVVLGERFDRSFYGDSVRRAERRWQEFLAGDRDQTEEGDRRGHP